MNFIILKKLAALRVQNDGAIPGAAALFLSRRHRPHHNKALGLTSHLFYRLAKDRVAVEIKRRRIL